MRSLIPAAICLTLACQAADDPSFEAASVKPASPSARSIECGGGPGTSSPGIWRCSNVAFHRQRKEMAAFELTLGAKGPKIKKSSPDALPAEKDPWAIPAFSLGADGCPVFPAGRSGLMGGRNGCYRWVGFHLTMREIANRSDRTRRRTAPPDPHPCRPGSRARSL
jgi:hypothetical protein